MKDVVLHTLVITFTDVQIMTQVDALFIPQANLNQVLYLYSDLRKPYVFVWFCPFLETTSNRTFLRHQFDFFFSFGICFCLHILF